jgi:predicted dehydrogenase
VPQKLRFGVIGAGNFAEVCHIPGLQSHPEASVVALCRRNRESGLMIAQKLSVESVYTDYRELLERSDIDAVTIVTPNVNHAEIAIAAFKSGKHVFCEKPLAMNAQQASEMVAAAQKSGGINQVAFIFRYLHCIRQMRRLINEGVIGRPFYVRIQSEGWGDLNPNSKVGWRHQKSLSGSGMLGDMGSHFFDLASYLVGDVVEVCGMLQTIPRTRLYSATGETVEVDTDDLAVSWFRTSQEVEGYFFVSRITPSRGENGYVEVIGEQGTLFAYLSRGDREELRLRRLGEEEQKIKLPAECQERKPLASFRMMRSFVDSILRGSTDSEHDATFLQGYRVQLALDGVLKSVQDHSWIRL